MIVVERNGTQLRCTDCRAKCTLDDRSPATRVGFAEYHSGCKFFGNAEQAKAAILAKKRTAMFAQSRHRQQHVVN